MEQAVQLGIGKDVCYLDEYFIDKRVSRIEITTDWTSDQYLELRKKFLDQKAINRKLIVRDKGDRRDEYMQKRFQLLDSKYSRKEKVRTTTTTTATTTTTTTTSTNNDNKQNQTVNSSPVQNKITPSPSQPQKQQINLSDFSFSGMHHIFVQHKLGISRIKFGNSSNNLLAFSSDDGNISVVDAISTKVLGTLKGHTNKVLDFVWSHNNESIVSVSLDGTARIWNVKQEPYQVSKVIPDAGISLCICNHPTKHNLVFISENKSILKILDISSGKWVSRLKTPNPITSMIFEAKGSYLFLGSDRGYLFTFKYENDALSMVSKIQVSNKHITSISSHYWNLNQKAMLSVLVNSQDNIMRFFMVKSLSTGSLTLSREYQVKMSNNNIKSQFSPVNSKGREGAYIVTGSEDSTIYFYDVQKPKDKHAVNQLMGHSSAVIDLSWNSNESLLASADSTGMVILWKRLHFQK